MSGISTCTHCGAKNRIKIAPSGQVPICGKCAQNLPWLVDFNENTLEVELDTHVPVLVDFWAEWCGPCRIVAPVLKEISEERAGLVKILKLNVDNFPALQERFGVRGIPTLIIFKDGSEQTRIVGAQPKRAILEALSPFLAQT